MVSNRCSDIDLEQGLLRIHFICGISTYHVSDSLVSSRMELDPGINLQDLSVDNYDKSSVGYHALDFPS